MSSINAGGGLAQGYGTGYIARRTSTEEPVKEEKVETISAELAQYKQDFVKKIEAMIGRPELTAAKINLNIDTEAFEKMRTDPAFEKKVLDAFRSKAEKPYPLPPVSIDLTADAAKGTAEAEIDYGNGGDMFANRTVLRSLQRSMLRGGAEAMRESVLSSLQTRFSTQSALNIGSFNTAGSSDFDFYA